VVADCGGQRAEGRGGGGRGKVRIFGGRGEDGAFERASGEDERAAAGLIPPEATLASGAAPPRGWPTGAADGAGETEKGG
jgi:hypothetical protein